MNVGTPQLQALEEQPTPQLAAEESEGTDEDLEELASPTPSEAEQEAEGEEEERRCRLAIRAIDDRREARAQARLRERQGAGLRRDAAV